MAKILTAAALDSLKPSDKRREIPDGRVGGLYFVLQPSGAASWAFRYRANGRARKLTLGTFPALSLADARAAAKQAVADVANQGDPAGEKRAARNAAKAKAVAEAEPLDLVESVAKAFVEVYAMRSTRRRSWMETQRILAHDVLPKWGKRRLSTIGRADVHALLDGVIGRGKLVLANRVLGVLKTMGRWARERGLVEMNPFADLRPPAPATSRDRVLSSPEIAALMAVLDGEAYPIGPLVRLLLLLGARRSEVAEMKWAEVDLEARVWRLPRERSKNGQEHTLPLPDDVVDILRGLPRFASTNFVFSFDGVHPVTGFGPSKKRIDAALAAKLGGAVAPWTLHDLRRSAASGMAEIGVAPHVVERVLNHRSGIIKGVAAVYNRFSYQPEMRAAVTAWSRRVSEIASGEKATGNVIEFAKAKA